MSAPRFSVVIPAHDEESVIARTLRFARELDPGEADVVVVANGCQDGTARAAAAVPGVRVIELPEAGKTSALNAGDAATEAFPRIYLDADIEITAAALRAMRSALADDAARICAPTVRFDLRGRSRGVRAYYRVYTELPYVRDGLVGLGVYGMSAAGRRRFERFPSLTNDDTYVQRLFSPAERIVLDGSFGVQVPHSLRDLIAVRTRVAAGNAQLAGTGSDAHARTSGGSAKALARLVARRPLLLPHAVVYAGVTLLAERRARRAGHDGPDWLRDDSTRNAQPPTAPAVEQPAVGYLVSQYPKLSHEFIAREIRALRELGVRVETFSVRPAAEDELRTAVDRAERDATRTLLGDRAGVVRATVLLAGTRPVTFGRLLRQALHTGAPTLRHRLWQVFYLGEASLLVRQLRAAGVRHLHVHLANNSADIARLAVRLGTLTEPRDSRPSPWTWSLAMHGPTEFGDLAGTDLAAKVRSAQSVSCISDFTRSQLMIIVEPAHWAKLGLVRMSVDPARYPVAPARAGRTGPLRVLFVGRLVPEKGPSLLLDALADLAASGRAVEARIVGAGPLTDELAGRLAALGTPGVTLVGPLGQDELPAQYAWADVFCLPSFAEGLPVVLMEAMATGLPVVTTRIAGIPELVVDGYSGLLVTPGRSDLVASALARLDDDPGLRERLGRRAVEAVLRDHDAAVNAKTLLAALPI